MMPFALMTMFYVCYFQGPVAVLEWIKGGTAAGVYNSAFLVISAISLIPTVIYMRLLMPRLCRWAEHERAVFTSAFHVGVPAMALIGTGLDGPREPGGGAAPAAFAVWAGLCGPACRR